MTIEDRLTALEEKTQDLHRTVYFGIPALQINARVGICTNFWMNQPQGEGAALSIGAEDRFALYAEIDTAASTMHPSIAIYAAVVSPNEHNQQNIAIAGIAANSPAGNVHLVSGEQLAFRPEGIQVLNGQPVLIGTFMQNKQMWP